jgi:hypothetical protein
MALRPAATGHGRNRALRPPLFRSTPRFPRVPVVVAHLMVGTRTRNGGRGELRSGVRHFRGESWHTKR